MKWNKKAPLFTKYLKDFTDDTGIFQHSIYGVPDWRHGYTTDDNARGLILAVMLYENYGKHKYLQLIHRYTAFLLYAQNDDGKFKNFMNFQRAFVESVGSEDCLGRCVWALGSAIKSHALPENTKKSVMHALNRVIENWTPISSPRAKALCLIGLSSISEHVLCHGIIEQLSEELLTHYRDNKTDKWHWYEQSITYGNAFLPMAMLKAFQLTKRNVYFAIAKESMDFINQLTLTKAYFKPIGSEEWLVQGHVASLFDEQPIEAGEMTLANIAFYHHTHKMGYLKKAQKCMLWYHGQNSAYTQMIDDETGACYDGIRSDGINLNQGSESLLMYGIAWIQMNLATDERKPDAEI